MQRMDEIFEDFSKHHLDMKAHITHHEPNTAGLELRNTHRASRTAQPATRLAQHAPRNANRATRTPQRESRNPKHVPRNAHRAKESVCLIITALWLLTACSGRPTPSAPPQLKPLPPMGYTIQVGAFSKMSNAVNLMQRLQLRGLNAYHFLHPSGLYKVRFGNYSSKDPALVHAENLKSNGTIEAYYIVGPDEHAAAKYGYHNRPAIRENIAITARHYIGVPYRWGGESPETGFDCSGYTMVVYRLNGFNLPRSSRQQWLSGRPVKRSQLLTGDLVFFATSGGKRVSHVGIYMKDGKFLHAPGRGREIKSASLYDGYFKRRYVGARSYL
jgi:cell wall-associated NlpC family hydrolase